MIIYMPEKRSGIKKYTFILETQKSQNVSININVLKHTKQSTFINIVHVLAIRSIQNK